MSRMRRAGAAALLTVAAVTTAVGAGAPAVGAAAASKDSGTTCTDTYSGGSGGLWTTSAGWSAGPPSSTSAVCITSGTVTVPDDFGTTGYVVYSAASISVSNGAELAIANEDDGSLYLNVGSISNSGTVQLNGGANGGSTLDVSGTMTNSGTFDVPDDVQPGYSTGGPLFLVASSFTNTGALTVESPAGFTIGATGSQESATGGTYTNEGTITTSPSENGGDEWYGSMGFAPGTDLVQQGTITNEVNGTVNVGGEFDVEGGSLCTASPIYASATVHFGSTAAVNPTCAAGQTTDTIGIDPTTNTNTLAGTLSGTVPAQYTVIVGESDSGGGYDVDATGAVNDGTITVWGGYNGQNHLTAEGTFTNNGTLDLPEDYANPTVLEMTTFDNTGTFSVEESNRSPVVFEGPASTSGTLDNTGTVDVAGGYLQLTPQSGASTTLVAQSGLVEVTGSGLLADTGGLTVDGGSFCTSTPDGLTETGSIAFAASVPAGAVCGTGLTSDTFDVGVDSSTMLTGTVPAAWTLDIGSAGNGGTTTLTVSGAAVNDGTIVLHGGYNGPINLDAPAGFTNNGTFTTPDLYTTVTPVTTPKFTNNGTLDDDGGHLTLSGALVDNGTTEITNVNLSVGGAFTVGKKGVVEALGSTSSGFGVLTVGTGSKLAGTLHLVVPSGEGTAGQQATIVSGTGLTGSFKKLTELVAGTSSTASGEYFSQTASSASDMITATGVATVTAPASVAPKTTDDVSVGGYPVSQGLKLTLTEGAKTVGKGNGSSGATGSATLKLKMATSVPAGTGTLTTLAKKLGLTITVPVAVS